MNKYILNTFLHTFFCPTRIPRHNINKSTHIPSNFFLLYDLLIYFSVVLLLVVLAKINVPQCDLN